MKFWLEGNKIVAVARNYAAHAAELGNAVPPAPVFFLKPFSSLLLHDAGKPIVRPVACKKLHYEVELGVVIGKQGHRIAAKEAENYVAGYVLALDMTARDLQQEAKEKGLPWSVAKGYNTFTPVSRFISTTELPWDAVHDCQLQCSIDGEIRQNGSTNLMIHDVPKLIHTISQVMTLEKGDILLTGTPEGVGEIKPGQKIACSLKTNHDVQVEMSFQVEDEV